MGKKSQFAVLWQEMFPNIPAHAYHPFSSRREAAYGVLASAWKLKSLITRSEKKKKILSVAFPKIGGVNSYTNGWHNNRWVTP